MHRKTFPIAGLVIFLALASGCGDSDSSSGSDGGDSQTSTASKGPALTRAEFIKKADSICHKTDVVQTSDLGTYVQKHPKAEKSKAGQEEMVGEVGLPPIKDEAEDLAALAAPEGDEAEVEAIVAGIEAALVKAEADPGSVLESDTPFNDVAKLAGRYGLKECANPQ